MTKNQEIARRIAAATHTLTAQQLANCRRSAARTQLVNRQHGR